MVVSVNLLPAPVLPTIPTFSSRDDGARDVVQHRHVVRWGTIGRREMVEANLPSQRPVGRGYEDGLGVGVSVVGVAGSELWGVGMSAGLFDGPSDVPSLVGLLRREGGVFDDALHRVELDLHLSPLSDQPMELTGEAETRRDDQTHQTRGERGKKEQSDQGRKQDGESAQRLLPHSKGSTSEGEELTAVIQCRQYGSKGGVAC